MSKYNELFGAALFSAVFFLLWKVWTYEVAVMLMMGALYGRVCRS